MITLSVVLLCAALGASMLMVVAVPDREQQLRAEFPIRTRIVHIARGALRKLRPHVIDRDVKLHVDGLAAGNEGVARLLKDQIAGARMTKDIHHETLAARSRAAGVGLYLLRDVQRHVNDWREWVQATKRDVRQVFRGALDSVTADGMIALATLTELRRPTLQHMAVTDLRRVYIAALPQRDSAPAMVDAGIIEDMIDTASWATEPKDLTTLRELRELVRDFQDLRVPTDLPDFEALQADVDRLHTRASVAQVMVINPEHDHEASAYYKAQEAELLAAGTASDRDDIEAVRQQSGAAAGE